MILAGLVAEPIVVDEWALLDELTPQERDLLERWARFPAEVVPYVEIWRSDGFGERQIIVRPTVPCVTTLP